MVLMISLMVICSFIGCGNQIEASNDMQVTEGADKTNETTPAVTEAVTPKLVTLIIWTPRCQMKAGTMDSMCKTFQALHPEWDIRFTIVEQEERTVKDEILKDRTKAGDIFFFTNNQLQELVDAGAIAKLDQTAAEMVKTSMAPIAVDTVTVDGAVYALPYTQDTFFLYYDKKLLKADDVKMMEGIMGKKTGKHIYNFCFDAAGGWKLAAWYYGAGLTIYGENGMNFKAGCNWNNKKGLAVTKYLIDLIKNKKCAYSENVSIKKLAAHHQIGAWFDDICKYRQYKKVLGDNLGLAVLPAFRPDRNTYQLKGFYSSKAIGVNAKAAYPEVAAAFAAYLGGKEMQKQRFERTSQIPSNLAVGESEEVQSDEVAAVMMDEVNIASVMQPVTKEFDFRYWENVTAFTMEIKSGDFNKKNAKKKLNSFVKTLRVK